MITNTTFLGYTYGFWIYILFLSVVVGLNWKGVWKGICGGNGIPQPNELIKAVALLFVALESGLHMFEDKKVDLPYVALMLGVLGISTYAKLQNRES